MKPIDENQKNRYFTGLAIALKREGLETMPLEDGLLPVLLDGHPICQISGGGSVRYRPEDMVAEHLERALQKATDTAETVSEYMRLMETAPILKSDWLDENYWLLADFKDVVLVRHPTSFGVQFVTWDWDYSDNVKETFNASDVISENDDGYSDYLKNFFLYLYG